VSIILILILILILDIYCPSLFYSIHYLLNKHSNDDEDNEVDDDDDDGTDPRKELTPRKMANANNKDIENDVENSNYDDNVNNNNDDNEYEYDDDDEYEYEDDYENNNNNDDDDEEQDNDIGDDDDDENERSPLHKEQRSSPIASSSPLKVTSQFHSIRENFRIGSR